MRQLLFSQLASPEREAKGTPRAPGNTEPQAWVPAEPLELAPTAGKSLSELRSLRRAAPGIRGFLTSPERLFLGSGSRKQPQLDGVRLQSQTECGTDGFRLR